MGKYYKWNLKKKNMKEGGVLVAQNRGKWWAVLNTVMNFRVE
jgi:hypothetical protein